MLEIAAGCDVLPPIGQGLDRPECAIATSSGDIFVSHRTAGVARIRPDGAVSLLAAPIEHRGSNVVANGIALLEDGTFAIANIADGGGIFRLSQTGQIEPWVIDFGGRDCPPVNFVVLDTQNRLWFSVSSPLSPRHHAYRRDVRNGFVGVVENGKPRIVLEGLHYTNEIRPDLEYGWLYVSETFGQLVSRFPLSADLTVGAREVYVQLPKGCFVDGIAFDDEGGLWAACIVSNQLFRVSPDTREPTVIVSEYDQSWIDTVESALDAGTMGREHFDFAPTQSLRNIASVAFAGPDRSTVVCGNLLGRELFAMRVPYRGSKPVHWDFEFPE